MSAPPPTAIALQQLRELWVHTGTACNLSCPFCHEGSKPGDTRLGAPTLAQLAPLLEAAAARGVERFAFTGGEPLILKGILEILLHALKLRPALVLTNGTAPFIRRTHQLALLRAAPHPLSFRVSIDDPDETRHDAGRGLKNFRKAMEGLKLLHAAGFDVGITRQRRAGEDAADTDRRFRQLLRRHGLPLDLPIVALPDLAALGDSLRLAAAPSAPPGVTAMSVAGATEGNAAESRDEAGPGAGKKSNLPPPCATGRMALVREGRVQLHACPLTDDLERFGLGDTLAAAMAARVIADHPRCTLCLDAGVDYAGTRPQRATFTAT